MNKTWLLLRTQIINYFSLNEIKQPGSKKNTTILVGVGVVTLILFFCAYNVLIAQALVQMGEQDLIPAYMVSISSFAILILTLLRSNGILFGSRDMDMLSALPIKASEIISSKFLFMYLLNFIIGFVFMVSGGIVWIMNTPLDVLRFAFYFISIFFVPLIPMCIASLIGLLIVLGSSHFKNRNIFSLIFSFVALGIVGYIGASSMQSGNDIKNLGAMLASQITGLYPLSNWFLNHQGLSATVGSVSFIILSASVFYVVMKLVSIRYGLFNALATTSSKYTDNRREKIKQQSQFITLYKKEFGRLFSSYMAVLNTALGVVMLCIFSIFLIIMSPEQLGQYTGIEDINNFLSTYSPIVIAAMLSLSCPAASSISLEGRNIWILQSSPVSIKTILNSKIAVNLTLHSFGYLLAIVAIMTRLSMNIFQIVSVFLIPIIYSLFTAILGITLNKKYPNYTWENEIVVIKQSLPVIVSNIISMAVVALPVLLHWFLAFPLIPILWVMALAAITALSIMYQKACKSKFI